MVWIGRIPGLSGRSKERSNKDPLKPRREFIGSLDDETMGICKWPEAARGIKVESTFSSKN